MSNNPTVAQWVMMAGLLFFAFGGGFFVQEMIRADFKPRAIEAEAKLAVLEPEHKELQRLVRGWGFAILGGGPGSRTLRLELVRDKEGEVICSCIPREEWLERWGIDEEEVGR